MKYILASGSPRRQELLGQIGMSFDTVTADVDESCDAGTPPDKTVELLSKRKGIAVCEKLKKTISEKTVIIAADTLVSIGGRILGKPADEKEAFEMLSLLSGRSHMVYTGVTLILTDGKTEKILTFSDGAEVFFRKLTDKEILDYIATGEPMDKAGAYGIQQRGAVLAEKIIGDFYTIVGLPLVRVVTGIKEITEK